MFAGDVWHTRAMPDDSTRLNVKIELGHSFDDRDVTVFSTAGEAAWMGTRSHRLLPR